MRHLSRFVRNDQSGFSLAEVVMATVIFTASVVGISGMIVTGGANVNRGATENLAANLASRKLEEVKSLPYYKPWDEAKGRQDIDDYYYNTAVSNANQLANPVSTAVEDYGGIPGASNFKRTTAIQYQYLSTGQLAPAVMASKWVPRNPSALQTDKQIGGAGALVEEPIHAMIIEVCVHYKIDNKESVYKQRGIAGDLMVTGGANNPIIVVESIAPVTGSSQDRNMLMKVFVTTTQPITGGTFDIRLWWPGREDIEATGETVVSGSEIDCYFDFTVPDVAIQKYNLSVYWVNRGFRDTSFRECFELEAAQPEITSLDGFTWGTRGQVSRQITIHGENLLRPTTVTIQGQKPWESFKCPCSVVSSTTTQIVANANLSGLPASIGGVSTNNTRWDVFVEIAGKTDVSNSDGERLLINPPPRVTGITSWPASSYTGTKVGDTLSGIGISGEYLQNHPVSPTVYIVQCGGAAPAPGHVYQQLSAGTVPDTGVSCTGMSANVKVNPMGFKKWGGGTPTNAEIAPNGTSPDRYGTYYIYLVNPDGQASLLTTASRNITHKQYTISLGSYQNTAGDTLFGRPAGGAGAYWQDETATVSAAACSGYAGFRQWMEGDAAVSSDNPWSCAVTRNATYKCRFYQYLYYNGVQVVGWICPAHTDNPYEASINEGGWIRLYGKYSFLNHGEVSASTTAIDLTNCTAGGIYWKNDKRDISRVSIRDQSGGDWGTGTEVLCRDTSGSWGPQWDGFAIPSGHRTTNRYIRIHAANKNPGSTNESRTYTQYIYVE